MVVTAAGQCGRRAQPAKLVLLYSACMRASRMSGCWMIGADEVGWWFDNSENPSPSYQGGVYQGFRKVGGDNRVTPVR